MEQYVKGFQRSQAGEDVRPVTSCKFLLYYYYYNHIYNKILKSDWFSTALISALIGQFNRTVRVMPE